jgi:hypothetical protein
MMADTSYPKADKYPHLETIYAQCSGPGGLKLAEFMAEKMGLKSTAFSALGDFRPRGAYAPRC